MAQTKAGALKSSAKLRGMTAEEYAAKIAGGEKWCSKGKHWRPRSAFCSDSSRGDGLVVSCSDCRYTRSKWPHSKSESIAKKAQGLAWCRECKAWLPLADVHAGLCRPHVSAYARKHYAESPTFRATRRQYVHARKRNVAPIPGHAQEMILEEFEGLCAYCDNPATTWDHIEPISKGGRTTPGNVVPCCSPCNSSKHDRDVWEWMEQNGITPTERFFGRYILKDAGLSG